MCVHKLVLLITASAEIVFLFCMQAIVAGQRQHRIRVVKPVQDSDSDDSDSD